jgi:hypothetical protein
VASRTTYPGCGDVLPLVDIPYAGYFHASDECWGSFSEALARAVADPTLDSAGHQVLVDGYAVQHAGGSHPDKSVAIHLTDLYLVFEHGVHPARVAPMLQRLADSVESWPRLEPPERISGTTASQIVRAGDTPATLRLIRRLGEETWTLWGPHRGTVDGLAGRIFGHGDAKG